MLSPIILSTIADIDEGVGRGSRTRSEQLGQSSRAQPEKAKGLKSKILALRSQELRVNSQAKSSVQSNSGGDIPGDTGLIASITPFRDPIDSQKSNLLGQKFALKEKIKGLEHQLAVKDRLLTKRDESLQLAIQEHRNLLGRLEKYKLGRNAAALHAHKLQEELAKSQDQARKWKASCTELSSKSAAQVEDAAAAKKLQHLIWSECHTISSLSTLACRAQRRVLELERKAREDTDSLAKVVQPKIELQTALCSSLRQQLKKKDDEIEHMRAQLKEILDWKRRSEKTNICIDSIYEAKNSCDSSMSHK